MTAAMTTGVFAAGVVFGVGLDDLIEYARKHRIKREAPRVRKTPVWVVWLIGTLCVVQIAVALLAYSARADNDAQTQCQADYNQRFAEAYRSRVAVSAQASQGLDQIIDGVASGDRAQLKAAIDDYVALREKVRKEQLKNPYPPLPDDFCGEAP